MGHLLPLGLAAVVFLFVAGRGVVKLIALARHLEESEDLPDVGQVQDREKVVEAIKSVDPGSDD
jgi:hypothetical protein